MRTTPEREGIVAQEVGPILGIKWGHGELTFPDPSKYWSTGTVKGAIGHHA